MRNILFAFLLCFSVSAHAYLSPFFVNANQLQGVLINSALPVNGQCLIYNGTAWAPGTCSGGGDSGTVTSVALSSPGVLYTVSGSPITGSGTLALNLISQSANTFLSAPNGSSGNPSFRSIVAADIPTLNQNTTGTAANITATSNSTLTSLPSLSLPYSQVTGTPTAVTSVSVTSGNGFAGASTGGTTPALSLSTTVTGLVKGNGTALSAATAGTDYVVPSGSVANFTGSLAGDVSGTQSATSVNKINGTALSGLATGILKNTTSTGVPSIAVAADFPTLNQSTTGNAATATSAITAGSATNFTGSLVGDVSGTQGATSVNKINGTSLSSLATGLLKNTTSTGVPSIATAGTDYVLPSGSITGTASNITATSNSTLTTLSALSLPYSQLSGSPPTWNQNTTGTSANITATSNSTLTSLPALSLPYSQVTGTPSLSGYATTTLNNLGLSGYLYSNGSSTATASSTIPGSAISGNIAGNAANITATSNSTLTALSSLILPYSQLSGGPASTAVSTTSTLSSSAIGTIVLVTSGASNITLTMPSGAATGSMLYMIKVDTGVGRVLVSGIGAVMGAGRDDALFTQYDYITFRFDGTNWVPIYWNIQPIYDVFTSSGSWYKYALGTTYTVELAGGGAGGGSGCRGASGTARVGGNGGGHAAFMRGVFAASQLPNASILITVGAAGAGGASQATDSTVGNSGTAGGATSFGVSTQSFNTYGRGGGAGGGGGNAALGGTGYSYAGSMLPFFQNGGLATAAGGSPPTLGQQTVQPIAPGGAGLAATPASAAGAPGITSMNNTYPGTPGAAGASGGGNGGNASLTAAAGLPGSWWWGATGGGGGSNAAGTGGNGGNAAGYGWGGAGGAASLNGYASGAGGNGAPGYLQVMTTF